MTVISTGTLMGSFMEPLFVSRFYQGSYWGTLISMLSGGAICCIFLLLYPNSSWISAPLGGCVVGSLILIQITE